MAATATNTIADKAQRERSSSCGQQTIDTAPLGRANGAPQPNGTATTWQGQTTAMQLPSYIVLLVVLVAWNTGTTGTYSNTVTL